MLRELWRTSTLVRARSGDDSSSSSCTRDIDGAVNPQMLIHATNDQENPQEEEEEEFQLRGTEEEDEVFCSRSAIFAEHEETSTLICLRQQLFAALQVKTLRTVS
eukprot:TRINITY_DN2215_c0_g1_i3.p2 TRINITY_DN2215_c0_g1~~TRINITY_DN2215_c0_g1_i3.p2  ORF type:complete len:105 (+),score=16.06 TRINITY_DN2215_c0_g1_i3:315-629(+)